MKRHSRESALAPGSRARTGAGWWYVAVAGLLCLGTVQPPCVGETVTVLFDRDNLPYSREVAELQGIYVDVAGMICRGMGVELSPHWADTSTTGMLSPLLEEEGVDLVVGVAVEPHTVEDEARVGDQVAYSLPFASVGYRIVTARHVGKLMSIKGIGLEKVGVELGSVAGLRLWDEGFVVSPLRSQEAILDGVLEGAIHYGVLWENAEWIIGQDKRYRDSLTVQEIIPEYEGMRWNLSVALRPGDEALLGRVNEAIGALLTAEALRPVYARYGMRYCPPLDQEDAGK